MKGQVSIEFILLLVLMITIISTISLPLVSDVTAEVSDSTLALSLASAQQRVVNTAEEVSMMGCDSFKKIIVEVPFDNFNQANITWDATNVFGYFSTVGGSTKKLRSMSIPDYIEVSVDCNNVNGDYFPVYIVKECSAVNPSTPGTLGFHSGSVSVCT